MDFYYWYSHLSGAEALAWLGAVFAFAMLSYAISAYLLSTVFRKAGIARWKAWVPFYNHYIFLEMGGFSGWWVLLNILLPAQLFGWIAGLGFTVLLVVAAYRIGLDFQKPSKGWGVLYFLFPAVWCAIIGFDSSYYQGTPYHVKYSSRRTDAQGAAMSGAYPLNPQTAPPKSYQPDQYPPPPPVD